MKNLKSALRSTILVFMLFNSLAEECFSSGSLGDRDLLPAGLKPVSAKVSSAFMPAARGDFGEPDDTEVMLDSIMAQIQKAEKGVREQMLRSEVAEATRVLILGITGAGKSTVVHSLAGKRLRVESDRTIVVPPTELLPNFQVAGGAASVTTLPVSWYDEGSRLYYWDCPGFLDSRGPQQDIVNAFAVDTIFSSPSRIKVLLVMQQSELTDSRSTGAFERLSRLVDILTNPLQLKESLSLVVTKTRDGFDPVGALKRMVTGAYIKDRRTDLISFLADNPALVFCFPEPSSTGGEYNFPDRSTLVRSLQTRPILNPTHSINLDSKSLIYTLQLAKRVEDVGKLIGEFSMAMQNEYRVMELDKLRAWKNFVEFFSRMGDMDIGTPDALAKAVREQIPSDSSVFEDILERIASAQRLSVFFEKCADSNLSDSISVTHIPEVLRPLLSSMNLELDQLIKNKEFIEQQKKETQRIAQALEEQEEEARRQAEEHKEKLAEVQAASEKQTAELRSEMERKVKDGEIKVEDAMRQLAEHKKKSDEETLKSRQEFERKMEEIDAKRQAEKAQADRELSEMRQNLAAQESQMEHKVREIKESSARALKEVEEKAQEKMAAMEERAKKAETASSSRSSGGGIDDNTILAIGQDAYGRIWGVTRRGLVRLG